MSMASSERSLPPSDTDRALSNSIHRWRRRTQAHATPQNIALFLVAFRILNALALRTFFQPDEFFQSLEPAWQVAFGQDSGAWITWEWKNQLRSSIHPLIFAAVYYIAGSIAWVLPLPPLTAADLLVAAPKTAQAVIAATGDYYTWKLAANVYGEESYGAWATLALTVLSPWQWFCSTRTLSNCLETTLTVVALYLWPWEWFLGEGEEGDVAQEGESQRTDESLETASRLSRYRWPGLNGDIFTMMFLTVALSSLRKSLLLAALACVLRPTNILVWMCLAGFAVYKTPRSTNMIIIREAIVCGSSVLGVSIVVDRLYYGIWTFPPLKFLYFNIAQSLAVFYGRNDWHYYLSQGLPLLLTTALPFAVVGLYDSLRPSGSAIDRRVAIKQQLATVCMIMPLVLSLIAHKEVRFIYPLLPALHVLAAEPLVSFFLPAISSSSSAYVPRRLVLIFLLLVNVFVAYYTTIMHASGPLNVLSYLRERHQAHHESSHALETRHPLFGSFTTPPDASSKNMSVGFLMPCHSTPWRSHLVFPSIDAWALSCEPPIGLNETQKLLYLDEADQFYENPTDFLQHHMVGGLRHVPRTPSYLAVPRAPTSYLAPPLKSSSLHEWPDYLIFFAQLEPTLHSALRSSSYGECWRTWNTGWHDDWRRRGDIVVWCLDPAEQSDWHKTQHQKLRAKREQQFDRIVSGMVKKARKSSAPSSGSSSSNSRRPWDISSYFQQKSSSSNASPWYSSLWPFSSFSSHPPPSRFTSWTHLLPGSKPKKRFPYLPDFLQGKKGIEQSSSLSSFWSSWWPSKKSKQPSSTSPSEQDMPGFLDRELWN